MGILGGLFGRSSARRGTDPNRCMECGMTGGSHTDWCPVVGAEAAEVTSPTLSNDPTEATSRSSQRFLVTSGAAFRSSTMSS